MASDIILTDVLKRRHPSSPKEASIVDSDAAALNEALEHVAELMSVQAIGDVLKVTWDLEQGAKLLHVGSGAGHMVAALRALGFDATGVECSREASLATPAELMKHNFHCDFDPLAVRGRRIRRRDRDGTLPIGAGQGGGRDRGTSPRDEARRASRICDDRPHDRGDRTLQLARGCAGPLLTLGLVRKVLCGRDSCTRYTIAGYNRPSGADEDPRVSVRRGRRRKLQDGEPSQWYEDSESLLYCVYERASRPSSPRLKQAPAADEKDKIRTSLPLN